MGGAGADGRLVRRLLTPEGDVMGLLLLIVLVLLLLGAWPRWSWSSEWGNGPAGILGVVLVIVLILVLLNYIPHSRFDFLRLSI